MVGGKGRTEGTSISLTCIPALGAPTVPAGSRSVLNTPTAVPLFSVEPYPSITSALNTICQIPLHQLHRDSKRTGIDTDLEKSENIGVDRC